MKLKKGSIFEKDLGMNVKPGYTISKSISPNVLLFTLGKGTDISEEVYFEYKLYYVFSGNVEITGETLKAGDVLIVPPEKLCGITVREDSVLLEITLEGEQGMNLEKGKVFKLQDQIEVMEGAIANLDIVNRDDMKFMLMSFDKGEELPPHAAPGDALVMALEGKAVVSMDGAESEIEGGSQFVFQKDLTHSVKALTPFKMALLLIKEG